MTSLNSSFDNLNHATKMSLSELPTVSVAIDDRGVEHVDYRLLGATLPAKLLEVGCGRGWQSLALAKVGFEVVGLDVSLDLLSDFQKSLEVEPQLQNSCFPLIGSAYELPFPDASFNVIFCTEVLEHLTEPEKAVSEMARVLAPDGRLFITVPSVISERVLGTIHRRWSDYNGHLRPLPRREVRDWIGHSGLELYAVRKLGFEWAGFWLPHAVLQTPFDVTGLPARNHLISRAYWKMWRSLDRFGPGAYLRRKGNNIFPKSIGYYARKPEQQ